MFTGIQLVLHLIGDYLTQSDWMANEKTQRLWPAICHATVYSLPFMLVTLSPLALFVIWATHVVIDRYRLAIYVCYAKNFLAPKGHWPVWANCYQTGYDAGKPAFLSIWLMIIADNVMHIVINGLAVRYL